MTALNEPVRAVIERQGRCREENYSEPYARLEDGRLMPMGWNQTGPTYPVGTTGTAEYVRTPNAGLWRFTPDVETPRAIPEIHEHLQGISDALGETTDAAVRARLLASREAAKAELTEAERRLRYQR